MTKFILILSFLGMAWTFAQVPATPTAVPTPTTQTGATVPVDPSATPTPQQPEDHIRVSVLGYHELSTKEAETAMRIDTVKFRKQMETLSQLGITVISMDQFTAWKRGEANIPDQSVVLTFDDGWKSVYTDAFPILKELKYPFTIYLYKNYIDGGGKALTTAMVQEMIKYGATIGSHSVSHPYPVAFKSARARGADVYDLFLRKEMGESKRFLESKFKIKANTYSYPGGYVTEEMLPIASEFGYKLAFTVQPAKVLRSTPDIQLPRYMILGNHDKIFELATNFQAASSSENATLPEASITGMIQNTDYPVSPEPGAIVNSRTPEISVDFSKIENLDPASLVMDVSGFAQVPAKFDATTKKFAWQVNRRLHQETCQVRVTWKDTKGHAAEKPLTWTFQIDRDAAYLLEGE